MTRIETLQYEDRLLHTRTHMRTCTRAHAHTQTHVMSVIVLHQTKRVATKRLQTQLWLHIHCGFVLRRFCNVTRFIFILFCINFTPELTRITFSILMWSADLILWAHNLEKLQQPRLSIAPQACTVDTSLLLPMATQSNKCSP